jgi:hypothetical protein
MSKNLELIEPDCTEPKTTTVGAEALKLQQDTSLEMNAQELQQQMHKGVCSKKSYEEEVWDCVDRALKDTNVGTEFFVVVLSKKERLLQNVVRQFFFYRNSCPTPEYDQTVYRYIKKDDELEFLWCIPNNSLAAAMTYYPDNFTAEQQALVQYVKDFNSGKLDIKARQLNKELVT